jgi:hypothetical protein
MKPGWIALLGYVLLAALAAAGVAAIFWWIWRDARVTALGFVLAMPLVGALLARPLVELAHEVFGWFARQPLAGWQGAYYMFGDQQVRVYASDDELWLVARDVLAASGIGKVPRSVLATIGRNHARIPGTRHEGLNAAGLRKLLGARREPDAGRFLHWFEREVLRPWERKRGAPLAQPAGSPGEERRV